MTVWSAQYHAMVHSPDLPAEKVTVSAAKPEAPDAGHDGESFFDHILDVVNPLQHLPLVGTLYRALTGDKMGPVEKIMGDTLYGGLWGAVSSIASVAFEGITGKSPEDTVLGWLHLDDATRVASTKVTAPRIAANGSLPSADLPALPSNPAIASTQTDNLQIAALTNALSAKGVDNDIAQRALYAYRRSMGVTAPAPVLASVH
jgi:hypothetical protein